MMNLFGHSEGLNDEHSKHLASPFYIVNFSKPLWNEKQRKLLSASA